jgi:HEPN domain-containing protein
LYEKNPDHWLYRLDPDEWLRAAENELRHAEQALLAKQQRLGVASARRAAGMAWNAVLARARDETSYGRSYMEHLEVLVRDEAVPSEVRQAAEQLVKAPLVQTVVTLGPRGDTSLARAAGTILAHARERVAPKGSA